MPKLVLIPGAMIRSPALVSDKRSHQSVMSRAVGSSHTRSIERERHVESHQHYVVEYLIEQCCGKDDI
jgi:hypothetical protein